MSDKHHHHDHSHHIGHHHHGATKNIKAAFFINLIFSIIEIVGGFYTNSIAILSDALHDLGDTFSLGLAWYFQKVSEKGRDKTYSYGYRRFSLLGAIINSIVLLLGSVLILYNAIPRLVNPAHADAKGMIFIAILGVLFNGAAIIKLKKGNSINERAVMLHLMEDVLGWVAVLFGSVVMYFFDVPIIDPLLSVLITLYILFNVYKNLKQTLQILLQGTPQNANIEGIIDYLSNLERVVSYHDFHIWSMDGEFNILTVHLVLDDKEDVMELEKFKALVKNDLKKYGAHHVTIEFEKGQEQCALADC